MRHELGDGYAEACWGVRKYIPGGADFVMHFWDKAAETVRTKKARRFGLITTNSITQNFSRRVIARHLSARKPLSLVMAVPDHPWMKSADKAAVRIAMTVGEFGDFDGALLRVVAEADLNSDSPKVTLKERTGKIHADFTIGADISNCGSLHANEKLSSRGMSLHGAGFIVTPREAAGLGLGKVPGLDKHILQYRNGKDLAARPRGVMVIDFYPLKEAEVRNNFPAAYQWVMDRVKPERDNNNRQSYRENWWIFGEPRKELRPALDGLTRFITTVETSKHRFFQFLDASVRPDNRLVNFGFEDAYFLGILSSRIHVSWTLALGSTLEDRPIYTKTLCFDPFPCPDPSDDLKDRIRKLGDQLDAHRKSVLGLHAQLTMTGLYNVLEKARAGEKLTEAETDIYEAGLVGVLRQIHEDLDKAVAEAYGWPVDLSDEEILERLVALNHERAEEEKQGKIRWLRPEFQAPKEAAVKQPEQIEADLLVPVKGAKKPSLPTPLPEQVAAIRAMLANVEKPIMPLELARRFKQGKRVEKKVDEVLRTLTLIGQTEKTDDGYFLAQ